MHALTASVKNEFRLVGIVLLTIVGIVLFVPLCLVMRPVLMAGLALAALATPVLHILSPRFRNWLDTPG